MEGIKVIPYIALILCIAGVVLGAATVSLGKFEDSVTQCFNSSYTRNTTSGYCRCANETAGNELSATVGEGDSNMTAQAYAICQASKGETSVAEQLPTVATIGVMVIIITVLAGVFTYMRYFR